MEFADEIIGDEIKRKERFILIDKRFGQSCIMSFDQSTDGIPQITIITTWNGVNIKIAEGQKVVEIEKDNSINFYIFQKETENSLNSNKVKAEDDLEL